MATQLDDKINVQRGTIGGAGGNDTYILSSALIDANAKITIVDNETTAGGQNRIQLIDGLTIASSIVANNTAQLTLSNGAILTIMGAASFIYEVGGNPFSGTLGQNQNYNTFVSTTLGSTVPSEGTNQGGSVVIGGAVDPGGSDTISTDIGTMSSPESLDASGKSFIFTDNANVQNNVVISGFSTGDVINVSNAIAGNYSFSNSGEDVFIIYNNVGAGVVNEIQLAGVASASDLIYDEASFEAVMGFNAFVLV